MIVPGPAGYSYNKVAVTVTDFNDQFCLKGCDLILYTWNKQLSSGFKLFIFIINLITINYIMKFKIIYNTLI